MLLSMNEALFREMTMDNINGLLLAVEPILKDHRDQKMTLYYITGNDLHPGQVGSHDLVSNEGAVNMTAE